MGSMTIAVTCLVIILAKITKYGYDGSVEASTKLSLALTWVNAITDWIRFTLFMLT
jgi:ABC-type multidrug transport system fused ATPase/permease subunit